VRARERGRACWLERKREGEGRERERERERRTETARASTKGRRACVVIRGSEGSDYFSSRLFFAPPLYVARDETRPERRGGGVAEETVLAFPLVYPRRACFSTIGGRLRVASTATRWRRRRRRKRRISSSRPSVPSPCRVVACVSCPRSYVRACGSAGCSSRRRYRARYSPPLNGVRECGVTADSVPENSGRFLVKGAGRPFAEIRSFVHLARRPARCCSRERVCGRCRVDLERINIAPEIESGRSRLPRASIA